MSPEKRVWKKEEPLNKILRRHRYLRAKVNAESKTSAERIAELNLRPERDTGMVELDCNRSSIQDSEAISRGNPIANILSKSCDPHSSLNTTKMGDTLYPHLTILIGHALLTAGILQEVPGTHILQPHEDEEWKIGVHSVLATLLNNLPSLIEQAALAASCSSDIEEHLSSCETCKLEIERAVTQDASPALLRLVDRAIATTCVDHLYFNSSVSNSLHEISSATTSTGHLDPTEMVTRPDDFVPSLVSLQELSGNHETQIGDDTLHMGDVGNTKSQESLEGGHHIVEKHSSHEVHPHKWTHPLGCVQYVEQLPSVPNEQSAGSQSLVQIGHPKEEAELEQCSQKLKEPRPKAVVYEAGGFPYGEESNTARPESTIEPSNADPYDRGVNETSPEEDITFDTLPPVAAPPCSNNNPSGTVLKGLQLEAVASHAKEQQQEVTKAKAIAGTESFDQHASMMIETFQEAVSDLDNLSSLQQSPFLSDRCYQMVPDVDQKVKLAPCSENSEQNTTKPAQQDSTTYLYFEEPEINLFPMPPLPLSPPSSDSSRSTRSSTSSTSSSSTISDFEPQIKEPVRKVKNIHKSPILASEPPAKRPRGVREEQRKPYRRIPRPVFPIRMFDDGPRDFSLQAQMRWLKWDHRLFSTGCEWRVEPPIKGLKKLLRPALKKLSVCAQKFKIKLLGVGGFNSAYTVTVTDIETSQKREYVLRVALPVNPWYKVESDVATTVFIKHFTKIPVPQIYVYDSSANNELGLEWILMEKISGQSLVHRWQDLDNSIHEKIALQIADWQDELSRITANQIGALYLRWRVTDLEFYIGRSSDMGSDRAILYDICRGPFDSINDYYDSIIHGHILSQEDDVNLLTTAKVYDEFKPRLQELLPKREEILASQVHKDDIENLLEFGPSCYPGWLSAWTALRCNLRKINADEDDTMCTRLGHPDISVSNIMVDADDNIAALLDWEQVNFLPIQLHQKYPVFLRGPDILDDPPELVQVYEIKDEADPWTWERLESMQSTIVATNLRPIYKSRLEQLQSPLLDRINEEDDSFESTLHDWVMTSKPDPRDLKEWIEYQLESDDEEDGEEGTGEESNDSGGMDDGLADHTSSVGTDIEES